MKKIISAALVCAMLASMTVTSFAETSVLSDNSATEASARSEDYLADYTDVKIEHTKIPGDDAVYFPLYIEKQNVKAAAGAVMPEKIYLTDGNTDLENGLLDVNDIEDFDDLKLTVKITAGQNYVTATDLNEIDDVEAGEFDGKYAVILELEGYYEVDSINIKGTAKISKKTGTNLSEYDFNYKIDNTKNMITVKENEVIGENVEGIEVDGDECTIDYSDFTGNVVNFKNGIEYLYLEGEYFSFDVRMSNQGKLAMKMDNDVNKAVSKRADADADLTFFNFLGNPTFDFTGTMTFIMPDEDMEYFIYKINNDNSLTPINAKLTDDGDAYEFKTRTLGSYVMSDVELETDIPAEDESDAPIVENGTAPETDGVVDEGNKYNPATGAEDFVGAAVAVAAVSAVCAGAVVLRRKED